MRNATRLNKRNRPHHDQRQTAGGLGQGLRQRRSGPQSQTDGKTGRAAEENQTEVTVGSQWTLTLRGDALQADRLLEMERLGVPPAPGLPDLFNVDIARLKSGDRVAIVGRNGCGKSSLMKLIWRHFTDALTDARLKIHPRVSPGYYDQTLNQLPDDTSLFDALEPFAPDPQNRKMALIGAGSRGRVTDKRSTRSAAASVLACCLLG
jgi:ATPase subunit of ABC transporter with duplicated ATPase domains